MCKNNVVAYKEYHGMASRAARSGILSYASVEGCEGLIKYTGRTKDFIQDTYLHLQASLSYGGAKNWTEFRKKVKAAKRSEAGIIAADVHVDKVTNIWKTLNTYLNINKVTNRVGEMISIFVNECGVFNIYDNNISKNYL